jgi:WD40 repeat protein
MIHGRAFTSVAFSPDGKTVLTGSLDGTARLWEAATGNPVSSPMKHGSWVTSVAFSPDGKTVLTGSDDGTARLWEAATRKPDAPPIEGDPAELLELWQKKLALKLDEKTGKIVPMYQ